MSSKNIGKRVVIAMSGGVDSAVAAALLKDQGYETIGVTLKTWKDGECESKDPRSCCSLQGVEDARSVADQLHIPFYVLDVADQFEEDVIQYFLSEYERGRTPNPCVVCNEKIKFETLMRRVSNIEMDYLATGHYSQVGRDEDVKRYRLLEGADKQKDQSCFLFNLTQRELGRVLYPVGGMTKDETRQKARELGLKVAGKVDSQEICFIQDNDFRGFLRKKLKGRFTPGPVLDESGKELGTHQGICFYTVGQRQGLGISSDRPLYVTRIDVEKNAVIVGDREEAETQEFLVERLNWINPIPKGQSETLVKIRHRFPKTPARIEVLPEKKARILFSEPQHAITPGQAAVFYKGEEVLGGGWIA